MIETKNLHNGTFEIIQYIDKDKTCVKSFWVVNEEDVTHTIETLERLEAENQQSGDCELPRPRAP